MVLREKYTNINRVLECLIYQVNESIDYCREQFPTFNSPDKMFNFLKLLVTYHNDPKGVELIQTVPTLLDHNYWGIKGAGDCDCFTVLTFAACYANDWNNNQIVLKGRSKKAPVHIYSSTIVDGEKYNLDLTNSYINQQREYPLTQIIDL